MRRIYEILIVLILIILLAGCRQGVTTIKTAELTESEKELLSSVGAERYFVFDVDLSHMDFLRLEYRVDYYEKGKLVGQVTDGATSGHSSEKKQERLIWSQIKSGGNQDENWVISFAGSRMTQRVSLSEQIRGMSWSQNEMIGTVNPGEEITLAAIVGTESGDLPGIIFDRKEGIQSLKEYDVAYVLTVSFHEDPAAQ